MNAAELDVSRAKSMVAALRPISEAPLLPQDFLRTKRSLEQPAYTIIELGKDARIVTPVAGRCHKPAAAALYE